MELSARSSFIFVTCLWKSNLLESKAFFTIRNFFNVRRVENAFYWPHNNLFCFCLLRTCALEKSPAVENRPFPSSKNLAFKARLSAKPLIWKWFLIMTQIKLIFTKKVSHLASFWKWDFLELGNGLLVCLPAWTSCVHALYTMFSTLS